MLMFKEPVRFQVLHPEHGAVIVMATCAVQAKLEAAKAWKVYFEDIINSKVAVERAALQRENSQEGVA